MSRVSIREARLDDSAAIALFTTNTFSWGDYVSDEFPDWLNEADAVVAVAVDEEDLPIAVARVRMLGPREGWLSAARVHPDHRRLGLGSSLNDWCVEWVAARGGVVCRLQIEIGNEAAENQVVRIGYRRVLEVVNAERSTRLPPDANGFPRTPRAERLERSPRGEADLAFMAWSTSDIGRATRGMFATESWAWRGLIVEDLREGNLWASPAGWVLTQTEDDYLDVRWLMCGPEDVDRLLGAVVELAGRTDATTISLPVVKVDWVLDALNRLAFTIVHPSRIYEKAIT